MASASPRVCKSASAASLPRASIDSRKATNSIERRGVYKSTSLQVYKATSLQVYKATRLQGFEFVPWTRRVISNRRGQGYEPGLSTVFRKRGTKPTCVHTIVNIVEFDWDPIKERRNVERHGVDFNDAATIFRLPRVERQSDRRGEPRWTTTGKMTDGRFWTVVYTKRGEKTRIISARRARAKEEREYRAVFGEGNLDPRSET